MKTVLVVFLVINTVVAVGGAYVFVTQHVQPPYTRLARRLWWREFVKTVAMFSAAGLAGIAAAWFGL